MQNEINTIAALSPDVVTLCERLAESAFFWGRAFIILSLAAAAVQGLVIVALAVLRWDGQGDTRSLTDPVKLLDALKGVLQALAALPAWVAIYLAGLALLWIALEAPKKCDVPAPGGGGQTQQPAPAPTTPPATNQG